MTVGAQQYMALREFDARSFACAVVVKFLWHVLFAELQRLSTRLDKQAQIMSLIDSLTTWSCL